MPQRSAKIEAPLGAALEFQASPITTCEPTIFKRVGSYLIWEKDFPRTASMKIKRQILAEEIGKAVERRAMVEI